MTTEEMTALGRSVKDFKPIITLQSLQKLCEGDDGSKQLLVELCESALRYTESVCQFQQIMLKCKGAFDEQGERAEIEKVRGSIHDSFISVANALSRRLKKQNKDISWRYSLGDDRSRFGRLALTLSFEIFKEKGVL